MARRLTEEQKENILNGFLAGKTVDELSKDYNFTKLTISRNLRRNLGEKKYRDIILQNKNKNKNKLNPIQHRKNVDLKLNLDGNNKKSLELENCDKSNDQFDAFPVTPFFELTPLDCQIENSPRKEYSSVPLSEIDLPKTVFMIVNKQIELEIKLLKDFPAWSFLPVDDLNRKTIEIFFDLKNAKRSCNKEQKVIKVPNTDVFRIVSPILISRGISRIVSAETLIAI